jgi:glyoxylase-like metal-dependent hydrolase (beta-lactamase superfamily II)
MTRNILLTVAPTHHSNSRLHRVGRREFLAAAAAAGLAAAARPLLGAEEAIAPGVRLLHGSVTTAVFERNGRRLAIDPGSLAALPGSGPLDWVLVTHHHRDQAESAGALIRTGARLAVGARDARAFAAADQVWAAADEVLDHRYNFRNDLFTPREPVPVARELRSGDVLEWEGLRFEVLDTPGHTDGSVTYLVEVGVKRVAFTGDLIAGPGQLWEIWSLQKGFPGMTRDYWGLGGAVRDLESSLDRVLARRPDVLVPSHGVVMRDPPGAVVLLKKNLDAMMANYLTTAAWRIYFKAIAPKEPPMLQPLPGVDYPKWIRNIASTSKAVVADDGSIFMSDCGHPSAVTELDRLLKAGEIKSVDGIWITHYHDDHTSQVNAARQRFGGRVHVQRGMVDIIENPTAYAMPCLFPESIRVDRALEDGETIAWKEYRLTAFHFPGQTLYHTGLLVERDGVKAFFTGDSFANWGVDDYCSQNRCFLGRDVGYERCFRILLETKPDILVAAHWGPLPVDAGHLRRSIELFQERERLCRRLFPHDDPNFGTDPGWARAYPHRQRALPGERVELEARIYNHSATARDASVELRAPAGWRTARARAETRIPARSEGRLRLEAIAPEKPARRREVLGLSITFDGRPRGELCEAIVDYLAG